MATMDIRADEISKILKAQIKNFESRVTVSETGTILSVGDGIARVYGLENALAGELIQFPGDVVGMVLNLEEDNVGIALFGSDAHLHEGDEVRRTGNIVDVGVGPGMRGRVVDALGNPIDGAGAIVFACAQEIAGIRAVAVATVTAVGTLTAAAEAHPYRPLAHPLRQA